MKLKKFDIVDVITSPRQEEQNKATVLSLTEFEGEEAAIIRYHNNSCKEQKILTRYMKKIT